MPVLNDLDRVSARQCVNQVQSAYNHFENDDSEVIELRIASLAFAASQAKSGIMHAAAHLGIDADGFLVWLAIVTGYKPGSHSGQKNSEKFDRIVAAWPKAFSAINRVLYGITADQNKTAPAAEISESKSQIRIDPQTVLARVREYRRLVEECRNHWEEPQPQRRPGYNAPRDPGRLGSQAVNEPNLLYLLAEVVEQLIAFAGAMGIAHRGLRMISSDLDKHGFVTMHAFSDPHHHYAEYIVAMDRNVDSIEAEAKNRAAIQAGPTNGQVKPDDAAGPQPLTVGEAAKHCGIPARTIRRMAKRGELAGANKSNGDWLIPESSLPPKRQPRQKKSALTAMPLKPQMSFRYCNKCGNTFMAENNSSTCPKCQSENTEPHGAATKPMNAKQPAKRRQP